MPLIQTNRVQSINEIQLKQCIQANSKKEVINITKKEDTILEKNADVIRIFDKITEKDKK